MKAGSSAKRQFAPLHQRRTLLLPSAEPRHRPRGKSTRLFVVTLSGSARPCWRRRSREPRQSAERSGEAFPDISDQASAEVEQNFSMRIREREQRLIKKIDEAFRANGPEHLWHL